MNDGPSDTAILEVIEAIQKIQRAQCSQNAASYYELGQKILEITEDQQRYGAQAVKTVAQAVRISASRLYRYRKVAKTWDLETVTSLINPSDPGKHPLTMEHLIALSNIEDDAKRECLTQRVVDEHLSIRQLEVARAWEPKAAEMVPLFEDQPDAEQPTGSSDLLADMLRELQFAREVSHEWLDTLERDGRPDSPVENDVDPSQVPAVLDAIDDLFHDLTTLREILQHHLMPVEPPSTPRDELKLAI